MTSRYLITSVAIALASTIAYAQEAAQAPSAAAPAEIVKTMPMHDHGAERGTPMAKSHMVATTAPKGAASKPKIKGHDHAKFHKLM